MILNFSTLIQNRRHHCPLTSPWAVIQCPKCRQYWNKVNDDWVSLSWCSHGLVEHCLTQLLEHYRMTIADQPEHQSTTTAQKTAPQRQQQKHHRQQRQQSHSQLPHHSHHSSPSPWKPIPLVKFAAQVPTPELNNVIRIEIIADAARSNPLGKLCLSHSDENSKRHPDCDGSTNSWHDVKLDYCFSVRYYLCNSCYESTLTESTHRHELAMKRFPYPHAALHSKVSLARRIREKFSRFAQKLALCVPFSPHVDSLTPVIPIQNTSSENSLLLCTLRNQLPVSDNCVQYILSYLPVTSLFPLLIVNKFWNQKVQTYEIGTEAREERRYTRLVEAWNRSSERAGVYVSLDHFFFPKFVESHVEESPEIHVGGYLQLLSVAEVNPQTGTDLAQVFTEACVPHSFSTTRQWAFAKPRRSGSITALTQGADYRDMESLRAIILRCLLPQQKSLLRQLNQAYVMLIDGYAREISREHYLFPFVASVPFRKGSLETKTVAFRVLFSLSY